MFVRALGAALLISLGVLAPVANAQTSVSIKAPRQVKPGARFTVKTHVTLPATAFITGGFMDFVNADPSPSRQKCPATPKGTFAADTPQSPQPAGVVSSTTRVRNVVKRTGVLR